MKMWLKILLAIVVVAVVVVVVRLLGGAGKPVFITEQHILPECPRPTVVGYTPPQLGDRPELVAVLAAISKAVASVDEVLKGTNYQTHEFGRTRWLVAEDKPQATVWGIMLHQTNGAVNAIEGHVYSDAQLSVPDKAQSFKITLNPDATLNKFWWDDKHEIVRVGQAGEGLEYSRKLGENKWLELQWDAQGKVVRSNVTDWTTRGRPVSSAVPQSQGSP